MSEDAFSINFGELRQKASEMMDASAAARESAAPVVETPAPEAPVVDPTTTRVKGAGEVTPDKVVTAPVTEPEVETPATAAPAELTDDTLVKVVVDGEEVVMPWKDARAGISRTQKFTKSMQQLARDREVIESQKTDLAALAQLKADRENVNRFLSNPQAVAAFLMEQFPNEFAAPQGAPNPQGSNGGDEVITRAEADRLAEQKAGAVLRQMQQQIQTFDSRIADATASLEHKQETAKHAVAINSTLSDIFTGNPVLKAIPNAEDLIRFEVSRMVTPTTTEAEALDMFRTVSQGMVEEIGKHYTNQKKVQAVTAAKAKLESKSIEPAGGSPVQIQPTTFKNNDGSVNWKKVTEMAKSYQG